jgi:hypothetical protein
MHSIFKGPIAFEVSMRRFSFGKKKKKTWSEELVTMKGDELI